MKTLENKTTLIFDLFFCVVVMPVLVLLGPAYYWMTWLPWFFVVVCLYMYACYFVMRRVNIPQCVLRRDYKRIAVVVAALVAGNYLITLYPRPDVDFVTPSLSEYQTRIRDYGISLSLWLMFSLVMGYSLTVSFVKELFDQILVKRKIEMQRDKAELAMFKAQISPHFMFNTLNSIYSLVIGNSPKAEDAFVKFTELLKYTYITIENELVPLRDEIAYIDNYIELQSLRLNHHTSVEWIHNADAESVMIPPMLMLTFVENAFKYGTSATTDCKIKIELTVRNGELLFTTCNNIMKHGDEFKSDVPVGIENCRARLSGIFPGRHLLETNEQDNVFTVLLKIKIK